MRDRRDRRRRAIGEPRAAKRVEFYLPFTQRPLDFAQIVVRTAGDPLRILNDVRAAVRVVDPELPLNQPRALVDVADASLGRASC